MDTLEPTSPRHRLRELLAIPERQRTDAQWDELNELEIALASANQDGAPKQGNRREDAPVAERSQPNKPGRDAKHRKPGSNNNKPPNRKPARRNTPKA